MKFSLAGKTGNVIRSVMLEDLIFQSCSALWVCTTLIESRLPSGSWGVFEHFLALHYLENHRWIIMTVKNLLCDEETKCLVSLCDTWKYYGDVWNKVRKKAGHKEQLLFRGWKSSMYEKLSSERKPRLIHSCFNLLCWKQTSLRYKQIEN